MSLQGIFFQEKSLFSSFLKISTLDVKVDKSRVASCFFELPHFPQAFRSDVDQLQVLFCICFFLVRKVCLSAKVFCSVTKY